MSGSYFTRCQKPPSILADNRHGISSGFMRIMSRVKWIQKRKRRCFSPESRGLSRPSSRIGDSIGNFMSTRPPSTCGPFRAYDRLEQKLRMRSGGSSKIERPQERTLELHWRPLFAVHIDRSRLMSALGHKQTFRSAIDMSALRK
jgi:hypothetical protein